MFKFFKKKKHTKHVAEHDMPENENSEVIEEKTKEQKKKEKEILMDEGLQAIYGTGKIDFNKFEQKQNRLTRVLLIATVILAIIASTSWAGFFVFTRFFETSHEKAFELSINISDSLQSGQKTKIEILYSNPTNVPIASLSLDINLPSTFRTYSFDQNPTNLDDLIWELGSLPGMSDGKITIDGVWIAQVPSETPVQVYAVYKPGNFNSNFEEIAIKYITTLEGTLKATMEGPSETSSGQSVDYIFSLENTGEEAYENIIADLNLPDGFYLQTSEPAIESGGPARWLIERLDPLAKQEVKFSGTFASNIESFQYFDLSIKLLADNSEIEQAVAQTYSDVIASNVTVQLVGNGEVSTTSADIGSTLRLSIGLENSQDEAIEDITVLLDFQSDDSIPITWNKASLDGGTITRDGIYWTIDSIEPQEKITLNTSFPIDSQIGVGDADNFRVVTSSTFDGRSALSSPIDVWINSQAQIGAQIRYYDDSGAALGSGPLPPAVGQTTTYRVIWTLQNSLHSLENVEVSAVLPPDVEWLGNATQGTGSIIFDDADSTVTWSITSLSSDTREVNGSFSISITPQSDDIGEFVKLMSSTDIYATDSTTQTTITRSSDSLSTDLVDDSIASAYGGLVVE